MMTLPLPTSPSPKTAPYTVAVLGATGLVGQLIMHLLEQRQFPIKELRPLASARSVGKTVRFGGQHIPVQLACPQAFEGVDLVLASAGGSVSAELLPHAIAAGAVAIDNTSHFRMHPNAPLVVAGVNDEALEAHQGLIANPNCSTAQLMPVLQALHQAAGLQRVVVSTYQSVSGAGIEALGALLDESVHNLAHDRPNAAALKPSTFEQTRFARSMAFNLIPQIDRFQEEEGLEQGYTKEELKLIHETRKILNLPELAITATAVRVPVLVGHSESVTVDLKTPLSVAQATTCLANAPHVVVAQSPEGYFTPRETANTDPVYVSRLRQDTSNPATGLNFWVVADNLRIGAALNTVRLAESLSQRGLIYPATTPFAC